MRWTVKLTGGPSLVNHAGASWNNWIFSFGGYNSLKPEEYDFMSAILVYRLDTNTLRWYKCPYAPLYSGMTDLSTINSSSLLSQRYGHSVVAYDNKIYMWGGRNNHTVFNALHCFDPETLQWSLVKTKGLSPPPSDGHSACVIDNKMYIFGGYEYNIDFYSNCVYYFDFKELTWNLVHPNGIPPLQKDFHSAVAIDMKMYVYGGRTSHSDVEDFYDPNIKCLDTATMTWYDVAASGDVPEPRRSHSAWLYKGEMYIFGGYNQVLMKHYNDLHKFSPTTNKWMRLNFPGNVPDIRRRQVCISISDKVYLFGGTAPSRDDVESLLNDEEDDCLYMTDKNDLHILDYNPTLQTLCIEVVLKHNLDTSCLPEILRWDIDMMTKPHTITT